MRKLGVAFSLGVAALLLLARGADAAGASDAAARAGIEFFEAKVRPVLVERCHQCHSSTARQLKAGLKLDTREAMLKGGESELPAIVPGDLEESTLIRAIRYEDEGLQMPPKEKLPAEQIAAIEAWVKMGAPAPADQPLATTMPAHHPVAMTVEEGRKFWSFMPPREVEVPASGATTNGLGVAPERSGETPKPQNQVDHFVFTKLHENGLSPSPQADKRTLIRRATYDLTGLPPTPAEVDAFEQDTSPGAFEKVIDRLLASPHYGERWARYWLDIARYADTKGYVFEEERRYAFSYTYRDWVIRALNEDLPYDQFLIQQIAADRLELKKDDKRPLAALGFLTLGRRFLNNQADIIDDRIDVVTRGTMALTVSCARCHDHKYDPIPTADYYSIYGVFASSTEPEDLPLIGGSAGEKPAQAEEFEKELEKRKADAEAFTKQRHGEIVVALRTQQSIANYLLAALKATAPHPIGEEYELPDDVKGVNQWMVRRWEAYLKSSAGRSDDVFALWRRFASIPATQFEKTAPQVVEQSRRMPTENAIVARFVLQGETPKSIAEVAERYAAAIVACDDAKTQADGQVEALRGVVRGEGSPTNVALSETRHIFGNVDRMKKRQLQAAIDTLIATHPGSPPRAMALEDLPTPVTPKIFVRGNPATPGKEVPRQFPAILTTGQRKPFTEGSGRLEFAKAIASKDNPLTARTIVNRVWKYHFGHGLVRTPSDFGTRGEVPTHPELLDWLSLRFVNDDGWSLKKLHKRIMLSSAYQQSSIDANPDARMKDPENRLLWRQNPQRLDFEAMRDSLLAAAGSLDRAMGGRAVDIFAEPFVPRRSIYAFIERQNLPGTFRTFDFASPDATSAQRFTTTVPQQALYMMNSPFVLEQAKKLAAREEIAKTQATDERITKLYRTLFGRAPGDDELTLGLEFIKSESEQPAETIAIKLNSWKYGYGEFDEQAQQLKAFYPLPHFTGKEWQGGPALPDPATGWAMLTAHGGHAGNTHAHAVVRRWTAPRDCTVGIIGTLHHNPTEGDGVRGRLVSSREGLLASWQVHNKSAGTRVNGINVKAGDTIDFIVDCGRAGDVNHDQFGWKVKITKEAPAEAVAAAGAGDDTGSSWDSLTEFRGPDPKPPTPLSAWEKYAQVLLESNEFVFVE